MNLKTLKKAIIAYVDFIKAVWSDIAYPLIITGGRNTNLEDYRIYGNSVQEGAPTPETPAEVQSVGELVTEGENAGKYKISVKISGENQAITTNIYLNEPLRKLGDYADYIDFDKGVVKRHVTCTYFKDLSWGKGDYTFFYTTIYTGLSDYVLCISNILPYKILSTSGGQQGVCIASGNIIRVRWDSLFPTLSDWKTFINNNESYIFCPRKVSWTEKIEIPPLPQFKGTTIYEVQTAVSPSGMKGCYYG